jgi:p-hydroxybenzoate 3-monooxygenase
VTVYGQTELTRDLMQARAAAGLATVYGADDVQPAGFDGARPTLSYTRDGIRHTIGCEFIAGCDGFHGICRPSVPDGALTFDTRDYPYAWFGVLAEAPPCTEELIYCHSDRGFSLHSMRSSELSRLYFQCDPEDQVKNWPDARIWEELHTRLEGSDGWKLAEGRIFQKGIIAMRSFVVEPLRYGRLFLAGDAAHIVPPTGAKGLNLAVNDVRVLASAFAGYFKSKDERDLNAYSAIALKRVWRAEHFSWWMTSMLHRVKGASAFDRRLQRAQLDYVTRSEAGARTLAENYVGLEQV